MKKLTIIITENGIETCQNCGENPDEERFVREEILKPITPEVEGINDRLKQRNKDKGPT